ncbi:MAG: c-type cytochrome, partial [Planctomycetes bacterium]|nr:c-type cytochrome [Planctomycetota bacterium]
GARRGEEIFHRPFEQMGGMSCATCHVPSANFIDHKRHDLGTVRGSEDRSRDGALDTPTLLGIKYTPPYFHDGSQPTLRAVSAWFNGNYNLRLSEQELSDLTAYLETVGDGVDAYEDTQFTLEAEMEEFSFFMSAYEFLVERNKPEVMAMTFQTIAFEIRAHKWDLQDWTHMPVLERMADLMDKAYEANKRGDMETVEGKVREYRRLYAANVENLR